MLVLIECNETGELQVQRVQAVMDAFFIEVETRFMFLFEDPKLVGIGALAFVALLGLAVVMSEIFNVSLWDSH